MTNQHSVNWCHNCHKSVYYKLSACPKCGSATEKRAAPPPPASRSGKASAPTENSYQTRRKALEQELKKLKQEENDAALKMNREENDAALKKPKSSQDANLKFIEQAVKNVLGNMKELPSHPSSQSSPDKKPDETTYDGTLRSKKRKRQHLNQTDIRDEAKVDDPKTHSLENLGPVEHPFRRSRPADESAKNAGDTKVEKPAAKQSAIVQLSGTYGWNKLPLKIDNWCYKHSHGIRQEEGCKPAPFKNVPYSRPLVPPVEVPAQYNPISRGNAPQTFWQGIMELTRFSLNLYGYTNLAKKRDGLQRMILDAIRADTAHTAWAVKIQHQIQQYCPRLNIIVVQFYHTLQRLTKHCYSLYCDRLLQELHKHEIAEEFSVGKVFETHAVVIGLQSKLRAARTAAHPTEDPDLPIREKDRMIWQEFVDHVCRESHIFLNTISDLRSINAQEIRKCLSNTPYAPVVDVLTTGGFGPEDIEERRHTLPEFIICDVDSVVEEIRRNFEDMDKAEEKAEHEKNMAEHDPDTQTDGKSSNHEIKEEQSPAPENPALNPGSQDNVALD